MKGHHLTISLGLGLFIILVITISYIVNSTHLFNSFTQSQQSGKNADLGSSTEGFLRWIPPPPRRWFVSQPAAPRPWYPPLPPPNYAININRNLSIVTGVRDAISAKIVSFNKNIKNGGIVTANSIDAGNKIEDIDISIDTDPIETITEKIKGLIQINRANLTHYTNMATTLTNSINTIRQMPTTDYNALVRSGEVMNTSMQYLAELNKMNSTNTTPSMMFETEITKIISKNYNLELRDNIVVPAGNTDGFQSQIEGYEVSTTNVPQVVAAVEKNIQLFAANGFIIDRKLYDKINDELNKYIKESVRPEDFTEQVMIAQCITPLKTNNIVNVQGLIDTIKQLSKYGYNPDKSIFFYIQKFNGLNIRLNTPEYNAILLTYDKYGKIPNLSIFLDKCAALHIIEADPTNTTQPELSFGDFMIKHASWGITTNTRFIHYGNKLKGFYTPLNKDKYVNFMNTVNTFNPLNNTSSMNTSNNKLDEFITSLRDSGIRTYEEFSSVFNYETNNSIRIESGSITVKLTSKSMREFMTIFKKYYNSYRYPSAATPEDIAAFSAKYPAIAQNTIPDISFINALQLFLSTFRDLQFTQNGCFGRFIQSIITGPKYMTSLLEPNPLDLPNPIRYNYYIDLQTNTSGFTTITFDGKPSPVPLVTVDATSSQVDYPDFIKWLIDPMIRLFSNIYKEPLTTATTTRAGYLDSIKALGATNTNAIPISLTKTVNDNEFFAILADSIRPNSGDNSGAELSMDKAVEILSFFASIQLPINQINDVLNSIKQFGVTPASLTDFTGIISSFKLGSSTKFSIFLDNLVKLNVKMNTLAKFKNDLVQFGFNREKDPQNRMVDYLLFTLDILIKYDITYDYKYDTCNTKLTNCLYNLSLDGINLPLFGNKPNNFAIEFLKHLNRNVDLYNSPDTIIDKTQVNKHMRDLIIRRSEFFYSSSDTSTFGKCYDTSLATSADADKNPVTLSSFPKNLYGKLFEISSLPRFMYELDRTDPTKLNPQFNGIETRTLSGNDPMVTKRLLFYTHIIAQRPFGHPPVNIPIPIDYCEIANILTVNEYDQMLRTDGSVLVVRSVMSRLLNKLLLKQQDIKNSINPQTEDKGPIDQYNASIDKLNMIQIFPYYSFYLISKYIQTNNPRKNDQRLCGDPGFRAFDGTVDPYVVELPKSNTAIPTDYPYYENYRGMNAKNSYNEASADAEGVRGITGDGLSSNVIESPEELSAMFYNKTIPYTSLSQYASW